MKWAIVSESLRSVTKNDRMSESLIFLSQSLIRLFLDKNGAICLEIKWANSQPCNNPNEYQIPLTSQEERLFHPLLCSYYSD